MMKSLWLLLAVLATFVHCQKNDTFNDWKQKYGKSYNQADSIKNEAEAKKTYDENAARVAKHNRNPKATYKQELNSEADLTPEEISKYRNGVTYKSNNTESNSSSTTRKPNDGIEKRSTSLKPSKSPKSPDSNKTPNLKGSIETPIDYRR